MADHPQRPADPLEIAAAWLSGIVGGGSVTLASADADALRALIDEASASRDMRTRTAEWLRARAEVALSRPDDPEQPGHEELKQGWRQGSYNSLHNAANGVERGEASRPRDQWPEYLRAPSAART